MRRNLVGHSSSALPRSGLTLEPPQGESAGDRAKMHTPFVPFAWFRGFRDPNARAGTSEPGDGNARWK
jgi:hypothetical protein